MSLQADMPPSGPLGDADDPLRELEACEQLARRGLEAELEEAIADSIRGEITERIAAERGLVATLRALPTSQRLAGIVLASLAVTVLAWLMMPRADMDHYPRGRMLITLGALFGLTVAANLRLLRPLHLPKPPAWTGAVLLLAGIAAPIVLAVVPLTAFGHEEFAAGEGGAFAVGCFKCLSFGAVLGLPVLLLAGLMRRANVDGAAIVALGGVAAGLTGNLTLQVHCPIVDTGHLLLGHASLLFILIAAILLWRSGKRPTELS